MKKTKSFLAVLIGLVGLVSAGCGEGQPRGLRVDEAEQAVGSALSGDIFAADVFNWRFYLNAHADLLQVGIVDEQGARNHWQSNGIAECRRAHPLFHTRQYLDLYEDLRNAYGGNCSLALQHYLIHGRGEGRVGVFVGGYGDRYTVRNDIIAVGGSNRVAGAVDSLYWNGREFINSWDHGRQLQVALSGNGWGECYNPTEAGGEYNGLGAGSTSVLQGVGVSGNMYTTQSRPAFWLLPGQDSRAAPCGGARNTTALSNYTLNKLVTVGYGGNRHIVEFTTQVTVPETLSSMVIEAPTGYLGGEFTSFYTFNPSNCQLAPLSAGPGEQGLPVILSTPDGAAAMGAWSPDLPQAGLPGLGYGRFAFPSGNPANATNKWNVVFRRGATPPGVYSYRAYIAVGSLTNVHTALCQVVSVVR